VLAQVDGALLGRLHIAPALAGGADALALDWRPAKDRPVLAAGP
jgi:hypothetical protein